MERPKPVETERRSVSPVRFAWPANLSSWSPEPSGLRRNPTVSSLHLSALQPARQTSLASSVPVMKAPVRNHSRNERSCSPVGFCQEPSARISNATNKNEAGSIWHAGRTSLGAQSPLPPPPRFASPQLCTRLHSARIADPNPKPAAAASATIDSGLRSNSSMGRLALLQEPIQQPKGLSLSQSGSALLTCTSMDETTRQVFRDRSARRILAESPLRREMTTPREPYSVRSSVKSIPSIQTANPAETQSTTASRHVWNM